jgi:hypothetical protein
MGLAWLCFAGSLVAGAIFGGRHVLGGETREDAVRRSRRC